MSSSHKLGGMVRVIAMMTLIPIFVVGCGKTEKGSQARTQTVELQKVIADPAKYKDQILSSTVSIREAAPSSLGGVYVGVAPLFTTDAVAGLLASNDEVGRKALRIRNAAGTYGHIVVTYRVLPEGSVILGTLLDIDLP